MNKIVQIDKLYDSYHCIYFGYVGIDLETGEIRYFKNFNNSEEYFSDKLWEFVIDQVNGEKQSLLYTHLQHCYYYRLILPSMLWPELKEQVSFIIDRHISFNHANGLPTHYIDFNRQNLWIQYRKGFASSYDYLDNTIFLTYQKQWRKMSENQKKQVINTLIHELGHMKARQYKLDEINNKLYFGTGFRNIELELEPIHLENGDVFYKAKIKEKELDKSLLERTLEEIINDLECSLAFPEFFGKYPKFGKRLNTLCNNRMLFARYFNGLDEYYDSLCKIINSKDLATELLENMKDSIYGSDTYHSKQNAYQIIKRYEEAKFK